MKNSADLGGCYPPRPTASVDNTLLDPTRPYCCVHLFISERFHFKYVTPAFNSKGKFENLAAVHVLQTTQNYLYFTLECRNCRSVLFA